MTTPEVSAIIIFLNEEEHLQEAIDSVFAQSFDGWELLLVDDGSTDASTSIARAAAAAVPTRVHYLEHGGHANRGMSASRNLAIRHATGRYISYLDGDDAWLPEKLERQLRLLNANPQARIVYGPLIRWRSWVDDPDGTRGNLGENDDLYGLVGEHASVTANTLYPPVELVELLIRDKDLVPSGALFERMLFDEVGRAEESFRENYEDAVVVVKMCLRAWAYCGPVGWYLYRQYPSIASADKRGDRRTARDRVRGSEARARFIDWVELYLADQGVTEPRLDSAIAEARRQMAAEIETPGRAAHHRALDKIPRRTLRRVPTAARIATRYLRRGATGGVRRIPVADITDEFALAPSPGGWNPYTALLDDYATAPDRPLDKTAFGRFFLDPDVNRVRDLNDLLGLGDPGSPFPELPRFWLGTYPWGGIDGADTGTEGPAFGWAHDLDTGAETSGLWGYGRTLWYEPGHRFTLNSQRRVTIELYESIRQGYSPLRARGFPVVTMLRNGDGERRVAIVDGHHRIAALARLGAKAITCEIGATVDVADIARWPSVVSGRCTREDARVFFDAFFELNGSERFARVVSGGGGDA